MKSVEKNHITIVSIFVVLMFLHASFVDARVHVQVINRLKEGTRMVVHCRSGDDDLGYHVLDVEEVFEWTFKVNIFETTLFYCDVQWTVGSDYSWHHFDAYDASRDGNRCKSICRWTIAIDEMLYGYNPKSGFWEKFPLIGIK